MIANKYKILLRAFRLWIHYINFFALIGVCLSFLSHVNNYVLLFHHRLHKFVMECSKSHKYRERENL